LSTILLGLLVAICWADFKVVANRVRGQIARNGRTLAILLGCLLVFNQLTKPIEFRTSNHGYLVDGLGMPYARLSMNPGYSIDKDLFFRRSLMPLLGHVLQLKGGLLYGVFAVLLGALLVILLKEVLDGVRKFGLLELFSLCTLAFVNFNFQLLGYPDVLIAILSLLALFYDLRGETKIAIFVFALLTHEMALILLLPSLFLFGGVNRRVLLSIGAA